MKFWQKFKILCLIFLIGGWFPVFFKTNVLAASKVSAPKISYSISSKKAKKGLVKMKISIQDKNGIKAVHYAEGKHRKQVFIYPYYAKKVKNVTLSSTKKFVFELEGKEGNFYSLYVKNKKGTDTYKVISVGSTEGEKEKKEEKVPEIPKVEKEENEKGKIEEGKSALKEDDKKENEKEEIKEELSFQSYTVANEVRAAWITFLEFLDKRYTNDGYTEAQFQTKVSEMFNEIAKRRLNHIYVHVRPFSDAMYESKYYPWSKYVSGTEGKHPGYDPLKIMVQEAHIRGLKLHAYINPYRVNTENNFDSLEDSAYKWQNPAYRWINDDKEENDRNVLLYDKMYYYNPAKQEVIDLITNGVKEIVENYEVDGVIFDDYFYPNLGINTYTKRFDAKEYKEYRESTEASGGYPLSIVQWRRENIDKMIKSVYRVVKEAGKAQTFGISPAGNLQRLRASYVYYADIDKWGSEDGFVDYLAPQLYWGFEHSIVPFEKGVRDWMEIVKNSNVKLYVALGVYKVEAQETKEWKEEDILARMVTSLREKNLGGYSLYRYDFMTDRFLKKPGAKEARDAMFEIIR